MTDNHDTYEVEDTLGTFSRFLLRDNIDIINRTLNLEGPIAHKMVVKFDKQLTLLESMSKESVTVYINSHGGDVYSMFAIIDRIQTSNVSISTVGTGLVASAAVPILASGVLRQATKYCTLMHHCSSYEGGYDRLPNAKGLYDHIRVLENKTINFLAAHSKKNAAFWLTSGKHTDFYFTSTQALEFGLIEEIV